MSTPADHTHLTEREREALACVATGHEPDLCDCNDAYRDPDERWCEYAQATFAAVERILSARPAPGPDAATASVRTLLADVQEVINTGGDDLDAREVVTRLVAILLPDISDRLAVAASDLSVVDAVTDRLAAASPAPDPATEDTETLARVRSLCDRWALLAGSAIDPDTREWLTAASSSVRAALNPAPRDGSGEAHP